jgi:hypothetical protein
MCPVARSRPEFASRLEPPELGGAPRAARSPVSRLAGLAGRLPVVDSQPPWLVRYPVHVRSTRLLLT